MKKTVVTVSIAILILAALLLILPSPVHAGSGQVIFGPIEDLIKDILCGVAKAIQDLARVLGIILWSILKLCGMVGLIGPNFDSLFQGVITDALGAVTSGTVRTVIQGSMIVSLGILGLSMIAKVLWPELAIVKFQKVVIWGIVIQGFLTNGAGVYTQLETFRTDLAEEIASAVASGSVPGCGGETVPTLLCIAGTTEGEVQNASLAALPDTIPPYGYSETIHDLYDHCVYNPGAHYGDGDCDPDHPTGDPFETLIYVQDALGAQVIDLVLAALILCYGILHIALALAAGMMFVLFPIAAIFAFYQPLEGFPVAIIKNYITIVLKSIVLLTLAGIVIRLFSIAAATFVGMAAVALVSLFICLVMAKEALSTLMSSVSFIGNSVGNIGANLGVSGTGAGAAALTQASPESRMAAMMIGGGPVAQALMGAPNPYLHNLGGGGGGMIGAAGGAVGGAARMALGAAFGGAGFVAGRIAAAAHGSDIPMMRTDGLPTAASTASPTSVSGVPAGGSRGGTTPAGSGAAPPAGAGGATAPAGTVPFRAAIPTSRPTDTPAAPALAPTDIRTGEPPAVPALQGAATGNIAALDSWSAASAGQIESVAGRLDTASTQDDAQELIRASYSTAEQWQSSGLSPTLSNGTLDPAFVDDTIQAAPVAAAAFALDQASRPESDRVRIGEVVALGAATQRTIPAPDISRGFGRAIKNMGTSGDLDTSLRAELGINGRTAFAGQAAQARQVATNMQSSGLANDQGRQLIETVHDDLSRNPQLTAQQFREGGGAGRQARVQAWDQATGDAEKTDRIVDGLIGLGPARPVTIREAPTPPPAAAAQAPTPAGPPPPPPASEPARSSATATDDGLWPPLPPIEPLPATPPPAAAAAAAEPLPATPPPAAAAAPAEPLPTTPPPATTTAPAEPPVAAPTPPTPVPALDQQLRDWRTQTAQGLGRNAFHVFSDATLQEIVTRRPQTIDELAAIKGVGPKKLQQYGPAILAMTQAQPKE